MTGKILQSSADVVLAESEHAWGCNAPAALAGEQRCNRSRGDRLRSPSGICASHRSCGDDRARGISRRPLLWLNGNHARAPAARAATDKERLIRSFSRPNERSRPPASRSIVRALLAYRWPARQGVAQLIAPPWRCDAALCVSGLPSEFANARGLTSQRRTATNPIPTSESSSAHHTEATAHDARSQTDSGSVVTPFIAVQLLGSWNSAPARAHFSGRSCQGPFDNRRQRRGLCRLLWHGIASRRPSPIGAEAVAMDSVMSKCADGGL